MTDEAPKQFPSYPAGLKVLPHAQAKPMLKLMSRAFKGKLRKGKLFTPQHKKRKVRVI